ncbi:LysR family transcriptional regulator [Novosphingobium sp. M1R2S20]|uniref:LysR family transcriptional regulator n=1 Tax=Novosphingobium rhizovicinum TaxID=3228928 RepID=A0ABV3REU1_9SPHN
MDTAHLKAFLRIAQTGSISRAAESLGIAQPSLSQQLLRLEDEVGTQLFNRTVRGVTLTDAGRVFQERAREVIHAAEQAVADARHLRHEARGQVVFAMPPSVAQLLGAALVKELTVAAPLVQVRIVEAFTGSIRGWIETEKIDLGIIYDTGPLRHLMTVPLASDELVAIGPHGSLSDDEVSLAKIACQPLITIGRQHGLRQILEAHASRAGVELNVAHEIDSLSTTIDLVADGAGYAVLPRCAVMEAHWSSRIAVARFAGDGLRRTLNLVRNPALVLTHASVRVGNLTRSVMERLIAQGAWTARIERET